MVFSFLYGPGQLREISDSLDDISPWTLTFAAAPAVLWKRTPRQPLPSRWPGRRLETDGQCRHLLPPCAWRASLGPALKPSGTELEGRLRAEGWQCPSVAWERRSGPAWVFWGEQTHLWRGVLQVGFSSRAVPLEIEHNEGHCDEVTVPLSSAVAVSRNRSS